MLLELRHIHAAVVISHVYKEDGVFVFLLPVERVHESILVGKSFVLVEEVPLLEPCQL